MKGSRFKLNQNHAPIHEALETFRRMRVVPFDVPGHKRGRGNPELTEFLGQKCVGVDVNSMKPLDNLCHPVSVIREAEELAADAFGAAHAFLMVGGTTSSVQTMVLTACKRGDEIILPRNVHRSVLNALVLCGAIPVYVNPEVDQRLGISLGMKREQVEKAIKEHPKAVAVLVNNPTYYGICSDLRAIVKMAHDAGMLCLADEAHGTHFYFGGGLPVSAMAAGAAVEYQKEHYPNMTLLEDNPRVESDDNGDTAYNVAKELIKTYPDLKGIMGTSSFDAPGVARAIQELGLVDKFFTSGTGMPADNAELLKSGVIKSLTLWDPAKSGEAMVDLACKVLAGEEIGAPVNLNVDGYTEMNFREGSETVLEGQGWITIDADNVDDFGL